MRRLLAAALVLGGLAALGPGVPADAVAPVAPVAPVAGPDPGARHDLAGDVVEPRTPSGLLRWRPRPWPGSTIRFHETIPAKWDWSLDQAVEHWNEAGGRIRLVETSRARARLSIGYGDTGGADGVGTLGYQRTNYVHLSPSYKRADEHDPEIRVWVGRLFTHELGHVLGFDHTRGQCSLMYPVYDFGLCPPLPDEAPGYYNCRWIDAPLLRRFVSLYGGRAERPPKLCLIEALPEPLRDVRFSGGAADDAPVRITWRPPGRVRAGTKVWVTVWQASSCAKEPDHWDRRAGVDPAAGSWTDPDYGDGPWCYRVQVANRYGATRPAEVRQLDRWAPVPDAPDLGTPVWVPGESAFRIGWAPPDGETHLEMVRSFDDPAACPPYDEDAAEQAWEDGPDRWLVPAYEARQCVTFFAVTSWGSVSPGRSVVLEVPPPAVTPAVGSVSYQPDTGSATVTASLAGTDYRLGVEVVQGACPAQPPADAGWWDGYEDPPGTWTVYPEPWGEPGPQCVLFAALDGFGRHGPVVARSFTVPG